MSQISIIGVSRGCKYSPNHVDNDAAIFNIVTQALIQSDCKVSTYTEQEFVTKEITGSIIFDMARDKSTLDRLKRLEDEGALVINSAYGIDSCVHKTMTELLIQNKIPHPKSIFLSSDKTYPGTFFPCWFKRAESHALVKEDVAYATNQEQANVIMKDFQERGIPEAVINEHLQGDLIKFYGVKDTDFFYWFYPDSCSHSKFGLEKINGKAKGYPFNLDILKKYSDQISGLLNVPIYGGDCIVLPSGEIVIIDFNDWPSFARCREKAGIKIAECIYNLVLKRINRDE